MRTRTGLTRRFGLLGASPPRVVHTSGEDYRQIQTVMFSQLACEEAERPVDYDAHIVEPCSELLLSVRAPPALSSHASARPIERASA